MHIWNRHSVILTSRNDKKLKILYGLYFPGKDKWIFSPSLWLRKLYKPSFYWPLPIAAGSSCDSFLKVLSHTTETARNNLYENSLLRYLLFCLCVYTLIEHFPYISPFLQKKKNPLNSVPHIHLYSTQWAHSPQIFFSFSCRHIYQQAYLSTT